jgi:hypothetical protein
VKKPGISKSRVVRSRKIKGVVASMSNPDVVGKKYNPIANLKGYAHKPKRGK